MAESDVISARFPSRVRLRTSAEFQSVFSACKRLSSPSFRLHAQPCLEKSEARLGVSVSKRVDKRAVGRNRLKRGVREYFRCHRQDLPPGDYVFIVKPEARLATGKQLQDELAGLFQKAQSLKPFVPPGTMPLPEAATDQPPSAP